NCRAEQLLRSEPPDDPRRRAGAGGNAERRAVGPDARDPLLPPLERGVLRAPAHPDGAGGIIYRARDRPVRRARLRSRRGRATRGPTRGRRRALAVGAATLFFDRGAAGAGARAAVRAGRRRFRSRRRVGDDRAMALPRDAAVAAPCPALTRNRRTPELRAVPGVYKWRDVPPPPRSREEYRMRVALPSIVAVPLFAA